MLVQLSGARTVCHATHDELVPSGPILIDPNLITLICRTPEMLDGRAATKIEFGIGEYRRVITVLESVDEVKQAISSAVVLECPVQGGESKLIADYLRHQAGPAHTNVGDVQATLMWLAGEIETGNYTCKECHG